LFVRNHANRRLCFFLDLLLALCAAAESGVDETAIPLHDLAESIVLHVPAETVCLAAIERFDPHVRLNHAQEIGDILADGLERDGSLHTIVAAHQHTLVGVEIARAKLESERNAAKLPLVVLGARLHAFAIIEMHAQLASLFSFPAVESCSDVLRCLEHSRLVLVGSPDGNNYELDRRKQRRNFQPEGIAMRHHKAANEAR